MLVRYADDLVACCHTRQQAEQVKARLAEWLAPRGLAFNEDKTRIVHLDEGFDFLGFNLRRYRNGKLLIKPSKAAIKRFRNGSPTRCAHCAAQRAAVIATAQPDHSGLGRLLPGGGVQQGVRTRWTTTCGSSPTSGPARATRTSRRTGSSAATSAGSTSSGTTGGCSATATTGAYLPKLAWTDIVRHTLVTGRASPDDPALTDYWAARRRKVKPPLDPYNLRLLASRTGAARSAGTTC